VTSRGQFQTSGGQNGTSDDQIATSSQISPISWRSLSDLSGLGFESPILPNFETEVVHELLQIKGLKFSRSNAKFKVEKRRQWR
jgi:hypothetical protein